MEQFKKMLVEAIESANEEFESPSREYSEHDIIFMMGYKQALQDMLEDFTERAYQTKFELIWGSMIYVVYLPQ